MSVRVQGDLGTQGRLTVDLAAFCARPADEVARDLVGARLHCGSGDDLVVVRLVETEAYLGVDDPASHAFRGRRYAGNSSLYLPPATWYVYRSYGIHWCLNIVTGPPGMGAAVLLRGALVEQGLPVVRTRRRGAPDHRLADGPGKLAQALGADGALDGVPLGAGALRLAPGPLRAAELRVTPRIGISKAVDWPLRFIDAAIGS